MSAYAVVVSNVRPLLLGVTADATALRVGPAHGGRGQRPSAGHRLLRAARRHDGCAPHYHNPRSHSAQALAPFVGAALPRFSRRRRRCSALLCSAVLQITHSQRPLLRSAADDFGDDMLNSPSAAMMMDDSDMYMDGPPAASQTISAADMVRAWTGYRLVQIVQVVRHSLRIWKAPFWWAF